MADPDEYGDDLDRADAQPLKDLEPLAPSSASKTKVAEKAQAIARADEDREEVPINWRARAKALRRGIRPDAALPEFDPHWRERISDKIIFDDFLMSRYLNEYSITGNMAAAAHSVGVSIATVRAAIDEDEEFALACNEAREAYAGYVQAAVRRYGVEGIEEKLYDKDGNLRTVRHVVHARLTELEAKRTNPEYRDKQQLDVNVTGGVLVAPAPRSEEDFEKALEENRAKTIDGDAREVEQ